MQRKGVTLNLLWLEYVEKCRLSGDVPYQSTQFNKYYGEYVAKHSATMHLNHKPGEIMQVDWAGDTAEVIDNITGEILDVYVFVAVLPYSGYGYVEGFFSMNQECWTAAHVNAFRYFGGVTRILQCDNLKTGVEKHGRSEVTLNKSYQELAEHYNAAVIPCRVRSPKDKAMVEGTVSVISTFILAALRNRQFLSLSELNEAIFEKLEEFNHKLFQKKDGNRALLFEEEKPFLQPLPARPFELATWKVATVGPNYHISVEKMNYSVPYEYIRQKVDVRITRNTEEVFFGRNLICSHVRQYGRINQYSTTEKRTYLLCDGQMSLFEQAGDGITQKAPDEAVTKQKAVCVAAHTRKPKRTMEELCANIPEEEVLVDLPEQEKFTSDGRPLKCIGTDDVRIELVREPSRVYKRVYRCRVYADPRAEAETGKADFRRPHVPAPLLPSSYASASVVTDVIVKKYADALPLYRQEQMWKRQGVELKRNTMANWVIQTAETYLKPFSDAFRAELLRQAVIHADETVVQVNKEPGRDATAESRIWAYASSKRTERQIRYFRYEQSRKGACAEKVLGGYKGVVISDGYSGYGILSEAIRAGCWAHARRKWIEAMPQGATQENALATKGLEYCSRLFEVEQKLGDLSDAERREQRRLLSRPIVNEYYAWLQTIFKPAGKLKKAIVYSQNQKEYLCAFLDHGEIEISNNQVENAIRPIVVGRKNWLFCDTQAGANASVVIFTLLETAKANGLNPEAYLNHLLTVLPERFAADPHAVIDDLMPWNQEMQRAFMLETSGAEH